MSKTISANYFRDGENGCSPTVLLNKNIWICGTELGELSQWNSTKNEFQTIDINLQQPITSIAVDLEKSRIAIAFGTSITVRSYPNYDDLVFNLDNAVNSSITHLAFAHHGDYLLISSQEADILIYSCETQSLIDSISTNNLPVRTFTLSSNEESLAIMDTNGSLSILSLKYNKERIAISTVAHHVAIVNRDLLSNYFSTGFKMSWINNSALLLPSSSGTIAIIAKPDNETTNSDLQWKELYLSGNNQLSHDNASILLVEKLASNYFVSADESGKIIMWQLPKGNKSLEYCTPLRTWTTTFPHPSTKIYDLSFSESLNSLLVTSSSDYALITEVLTVEETGSDSVVAAKVVAVEKEELLMEVDTAEDEKEEELLPSSQAVLQDTLVDGDDAFNDEALLAIDLDAFTAPSPAKPAANPPHADLTTVKTAASSEVEKKSNTTVLSPEKNSVAPAKTNKVGNSLGSLLQEKPTEQPVLSRKEQLKALFDEEAEEGDDEDDEEEDRPAKQNKDDGEMLMEEEDDEMEELLLSANDGEAGEGETGGKTTSYVLTEVLKLKKQLQSRSFLQTVGYHPIVHPSASPFDEKRRRYLVWNQIGNITLREEYLENRIEIRFTDLTVGKNETISDRNGFVMAALGVDGAAFATDLPEETEEEKLRRTKMTAEDLAEEAIDPNAKGSLLYYHAFQGNHHLDGVNQSFRIQLYQREKIETIAVGKGFIAITTSKDYLRIYNSIGVEMYVSFLKGKKEKEQLANNKEKFHQYFYETMKMQHYSHSLDQRNILYNLDYDHSMGVMSGSGEALEKISMFDNPEMTNMLQLTSETHQQYEKLLLKLFQEAIVSQQMAFALSLVYQMRTMVSLQTAIVIANHFGRRGIAERIDQVLQQKITFTTSMITPAGVVADDSEALMTSETVGIAERRSNGGAVKRGRSEEENSDPAANKLSRKVNAMKSSTTSATTANAKVVSPNLSTTNTAMGKKAEREEVNDPAGEDPFTYQSHDEEEGETVPVTTKPPLQAKKLNPFMIQKTGTTPLKRKSVTEDLTENLKYSPSPKKPALSRQSTFSQNARKEKFTNNKNYFH